MHIEEISDDVAERLKLNETDPQTQQEQATSNEPQNGPTPPPTVGPELSPGRAMTSSKTIDEVVAELKSTPFFMTELEENDETEAFKALAYEGTPLENGTDFKERGNECFKLKQWGDAKEFYTKGILILAAEERMRRQDAELGAAKPKSRPTEGKQNEKGEATEEEIHQQRAILESLYGNRAACHLELKNYRSAWLDGSAALRLNPKNIKAYYRSARAFLAVGRIAEADDACSRGLELDPSNASLKAVARDIIKRAEEADAKARKEAESAAKENRRKTLIKAALAARQIRTRSTAQPPEMEDAGLRLEPDPDDPASNLAFPTVLLYPCHLESDFIKSFNETHSLTDHLSYVFPLPWDKEGVYSLAGVECFMETVTGGLIKVGKKVPLLKMLAGGKVEVVDEVVRIFVVPKDKATGWVEDFKMKRVAEKGEK
ncbi:TPR-like protein [Xylariaceae sp. FL1272]|nr:TPR-like protein [Xylariaceae sp. FL1272]